MPRQSGFDLQGRGANEGRVGRAQCGGENTRGGGGNDFAFLCTLHGPRRQARQFRNAGLGQTQDGSLGTKNLSIEGDAPATFALSGQLQGSLSRAARPAARRQYA